MSPEYRISGNLTFEEYLEAHRVLASRRRWLIRGVFLIVGLWLVLYFGLFRQSGRDLTLVMWGALLLVYSLFLSPVQFRFRVRRNWERYPKIRKPLDLVVTEEGLCMQDDKGNPSHTDWDSFIAFRESPRLFLLYLSPLLPLILPKRLLGEGDLEEIRQLLASKIAGTAKTANP